VFFFLLPILLWFNVATATEFTISIEMFTMLCELD